MLHLADQNKTHQLVQVLKGLCKQWSGLKDWQNKNQDLPLPPVFSLFTNDIQFSFKRQIVLQIRTCADKYLTDKRTAFCATVPIFPTFTGAVLHPRTAWPSCSISALIC